MAPALPQAADNRSHRALGLTREASLSNAGAQKWPPHSPRPRTTVRTARLGLHRKLLYLMRGPRHGPLTPPGRGRLASSAYAGRSSLLGLAGAREQPDVQEHEARDGDEGEHEVGEADRLLAGEAGGGADAPPERLAHEAHRVAVQRGHADHLDQDVVAVHLQEAERVEADEERLDLEDRGGRDEALHEAGLEQGGDPEAETAQEEMEERPRHRVDDPGPAAGHEDVGHVGVEGRDEAVQDREAELAHAPLVVDAGQRVD